MEISKITTKGQITIPVSIRKELNLNPGDKLIFVKEGDGYIIMKASDKIIKGGADEYKQ